MTFVIDTNAKHGKDEEDAKEDGAHGHACVDCDDCRDGSCEKPQGLRFFGPYGLDFCENPSLFPSPNPGQPQESQTSERPLSQSSPAGPASDSRPEGRNRKP